jgi:hypothetical protein
VIVVDDASADPETTNALDRLERDAMITVVRLAQNSGPSVARNRALTEVTESYVLPLDADDMLLPQALESMVAQLERAPDSIGFIYPNVRHFGNRHDYYEAPAYNLDALLRDNYCAAAALFDRRIFDAGIRYAEDIVHGHEDWDLVLQMAERRIHGEPAEGPTLLYRKRGFSRVNAVEYGAESFHERIERRHPLLYDEQRETIKANWAPALSLVLVDACDGSAEPWPSRLGEDLVTQTCRDFEVVHAGMELEPADGLSVHRVEGGVLEGIQHAVPAARGRYVVLLGSQAVPALLRPTFVEQIIGLFWMNAKLPHFVLGSVDGRRGPRLAALSARETALAVPRAIAWQRDPEAGPSKVSLGAAQTPIEDFILHWQDQGPVAWRAL